MHEDPDQDISKNLVHIQMHRRAKGLKKLGELARTRQVCSTTLRQMLQPVVWHIVIEPMEKDRMKREDGAYNISDEVNLVWVLGFRV